MYHVHPFLQIIATLLGVYVARLGVQRFRMLHLGAKVRFDWRRHVTLGLVVMPAWFFGLLGGLALGWLKWGTVLVTGAHYKAALVMLPLMALGAASGLYMDRNKAKRTWLPLLHGACNLAALALALYQIRTGVWVIRNFLS
ncbi:MAG: DUF4079 family protein [Desulfovibrionaceae bacterium]|nr:DUF4079 family protein [Desulfovibrionaceae bacterium]